MASGARTPCFLLTELPKLRLQLRRYHIETIPCCLKGTYHNAFAELGEVDHPIGETIKLDEIERAAAVADDDPRWPVKCECGYVFTPEDRRQVFSTRLYRAADGRVFSHREFPPGAMHWVERYHGGDSERHRQRGGGPHLHVVLPDGRTWDVDAKSSNGDGWTRTGSPPLVVASPSVDTGTWHGHLGGSDGAHPGVLIEC